jgi:hypothetical protein
MQSNIHFSPRPICVSRLIARPVEEHKDQAFLASRVITIALVATALLGLLFPLGPSRSSWKVAPIPSSFSASAALPNRAAKGDRLPGVQTTSRDSASTRAESRPVQRTDGRIPFGCDGAFSRLVKSGNFAARCVTAVDAATKFASAVYLATGDQSAQA